MKVAYLRVSTNEQSFDEQRREILKQHPNIDKWIEEQSSDVKEKLKVEDLIENVLQPSDELIVYSLSRVGRNRKELTIILEKLQAHSIILKSVKEKYNLTPVTTKSMLDLLSILANYEKDILIERQAAGIEAAKQRGAYTGRTMVKLKDLEYFEQCFQKYENLPNFKLKHFQKSIGLKESTLIKFINLRRKLGKPFPNEKNFTLKSAEELLKKQLK